MPMLKNNYVTILAEMWLIFLILLYPNPRLSKESPPQLVVWNVGQGQWVTWSDPRYCLHFDMGGEFVRWKGVTQLCQKKINVLFLSHGDWDHISFISKARRRLPSLCLAALPLEPLSPKKRKILLSLPPCPSNSPWTSLVLELTPASFVAPSSPHKRRLKRRAWRIPKKTIFRGTDKNISHGKGNRSLHSNDLSRVFLLKNQILIPGDSTSFAEKLWIPRLPIENNIHYLVLGHHGSRGSTSTHLLNQLNHLILALASARKRRYGHPHHLVLDRLKKNGAPLISTEQWGNIHILFKEEF